MGQEQPKAQDYAPVLTGTEDVALTVISLFLCGLKFGGAHSLSVLLSRRKELVWDTESKPEPRGHAF